MQDSNINYVISYQLQVSGQFLAAAAFCMIANLVLTGITLFIIVSKKEPPAAKLRVQDHQFFASQAEKKGDTE